MAKQIEMPKAYPVPSNWIWTELGKLVQILSGYPFQSSLFENDESNGRPLIRIRDIVAGETNTYTSEDCPDEYIVKSGEILIGMDGDFNIAKWQSNDALLNQRVCKITSKSDVLLNDYMFYFLPETLKKINDATPSVTVKHLSTKTIEGILIPLPPLAEQKRIVEQIENLFSKLDEAKEKAQDIVLEYKDEKEAILGAALSGKLIGYNGKVQEYSIEYFLQEEKNAIKAGPFGSALKKEVYVESGYKVYGQEQVINGCESIGDYYIDDDKYNELIACKVSPNDVLISLVGTVGKVLILSNECKPGIINPRLIKISLNQDKMLPKFFKYYFESEYLRGLYKNESHGTTMDVLNMGIIKSLPFPAYSIDEQERIVEILDETLPRLLITRNIAENVIDSIEVMKKSILVKAFRGELGTNIVDEESSIELLKQIISG